MSGLVYLRSLMDGVEMRSMNGPVILLILGMIFIVVDAVYLGRVVRARMNNKRALRSNVVHQFHRHVIDRNNPKYSGESNNQNFDNLFLGLFFDCIIDHLEYKDVTKDQLADKMQISTRQLDLASKKATGLPAMKVVSIVKSEYGVRQ
ncbi:hypothetical protein [Hallella mizrahii]|jgi:hypothetical protein|uniref:Uncharacterized protein n=1 Tax=Hallella mizrahii TaxID=2606637 RepID=A0A7K0KI05_9BACT|nr:hypothetical protein [Hallella mizrahii]MST85566.1 hypothetical protein [Hallella mizrahii]